MSRILVAIVAAGIALGSSAGFAADAGKSPELTKDERAEMRNRAEKLSAERARPVAQPDTTVGKTHKVTKPHATKSSTKKSSTKKSSATKAGATKTGATTKAGATKADTTKSGTTTPGKGTTPAVKKDEPKVY